MTRIVAATLVCLFAVAASGAQDEKSQLRYGFKKGEKFPMKMTYGMGVKLDKVPEAFQGVLSDEPINLKLEGTLDMEVKDVAENGKAVLEGTWKTMKAKGAVMVNDVDFNYDSEKKDAVKPKKKEEGEDPGLQGFFDLEDQLRKTATQPLKLTVDDRGKVTVDGASAKGMGEMNAMFLSMNGLMGALPKDKVGQGDTWKEETKLSMPGVGGAVDIRVKSENKWESTETVEGKPFAVIKSKFAVGGDVKAEGEGDNNPFNIKMKTVGDGEGKTSFAVKGGFASKVQGALKVKVSATVPNPGGGDDMDIKATLKIEQSLEIKK
jgi:hypothetical protein